MLRRHASLIVAIALIVLVATACIIRTDRRRRGAPPPGYRPAPHGKQSKQWKKKKHKKRIDEQPSSGIYDYTQRTNNPDL